MDTGREGQYTRGHNRKDTGHRSVGRNENMVGFGVTVQGQSLMKSSKRSRAVPVFYIQQVTAVCGCVCAGA